MVRRKAPKEEPGAKGPLERFEKLRELGRGASGTVWLVRRREDKQLLAMKSVPLPSLASGDEAAVAKRKQALMEVEVLKSCSSPHLVRYVDAVLTPATSSKPAELHIFTEHCDAGDLSSHIRQSRPKQGFPEDEVWRYALAILQGLQALHCQRILHRDLKPANIFLARGEQRSGLFRKARAPLRLLVGDLGLARVLSESQSLASTVVGTPHYLAPEMFEGEPYDEKADVYSFGVVVYELMHGCTPYSCANNIAALLKRVLEAEPPAMDERYSPQLRELVTACLRRLPSARPTAAELLALYKAPGSPPEPSFAFAPPRRRSESGPPTVARPLLAASPPSTPRARSVEPTAAAPCKPQPLVAMLPLPVDPPAAIGEPQPVPPRVVTPPLPVAPPAAVATPVAPPAAQQPPPEMPRPASARPSSARSARSASSARPSSAGSSRQQGSVFSYVGRARECISRWQRERCAAAMRRPAPVGAGLEVRGVGLAKKAALEARV